MKAAALMQEICKLASWQGEKLELEQAQAACRVSLRDYELQLAAFHEDELYLYVDLVKLPEGPQALDYLKKAGACAAQCWRDHPFYLCLQDGFLRAELVLSDLEPDQAAPLVENFLDDIDFVLQCLRELERPESSWSGFQMLGGLF